MTNQVNIINAQEAFFLSLKKDNKEKYERIVKALNDISNRINKAINNGLHHIDIDEYYKLNDLDSILMILLRKGYGILQSPDWGNRDFKITWDSGYPNIYRLENNIDNLIRKFSDLSDWD